MTDDRNLRGSLVVLGEGLLRPRGDGQVILGATGKSLVADLESDVVAF